jgi:glycerol-3-phosphate dehydrogenase
VSRLRGLETQVVDAVVIGGGLAGAAITRDLALRGLTAILVDKGDFGAGATASAPRLIPGGLDELARGALAAAQRAGREQAILERLAPTLVHPVPLLTPLYRGDGRRLGRLRLALAAHRWLFAAPGAPPARLLDPVGARRLEPALRAEGLRGAGLHQAAVLRAPERLCLEHVLAAGRAGVRALNYVQAEELKPGLRSGWLVRVRDLVGGEQTTLEGRVLINATGPWVDRLRARAGLDGEAVARVRTGLQLVLSRLTRHAVALSGRETDALTGVPGEELSILDGTSAEVPEHPDRALATAAQVATLLEAARRILDDPRLAPSAVLAARAAAVPEPGAAGRIVAEGAEGRFVSVVGVAPASARRVAETVGRRLVAQLGRGGPGLTGRVALDGPDGETLAPGPVPARLLDDPRGPAGLEPEQVARLLSTHGPRAAAVLERARRVPEGTARLCPGAPEIAAQVDWAVERELAVSLQDVLLRRTGLGSGPCRGLDCAEAVARRMAALCGWSARRVEAELDAYHAAIQRTLRFRAV